MVNNANGAVAATTTPQEYKIKGQDKDNNITVYKSFNDAFNNDLSKANNHFKKPFTPLQPPGIPNDEELNEILKKCLLSHDLQIMEPPICIEISGIKGSSIISTLGNFLAIIGKAKSRKTFFVSLIIAAAIANKLLMDKIKCHIEEGKNKVLLFDTEQSTYHAQKVFRRILATAEINEAPNLEVYCLRTIAPKKRLAAIKHKIYNTPGLAIAVIDGIKDLVFDINDGQEATETTTELMKWSEEVNCHIVVVLHQNKGDNNARGHLGTEIVNKAETVISVTKDADNSDLSIVTPEYCREKEFEPFAFSVDPKGLPYIVTDWIAQNTKEGKKASLTANQIPDDTHLKALRQIFSLVARPKYNELQTQIKLAFEQYGIGFGLNKAGDFLTYYKNKGWIAANDVRLPGERTTTYYFIQLL